MKSISITNSDNKKLTVYQSAGKGQNILFVHGNSLGAELYAKQFSSNIGEKYRCVSFDFPGHGNSDIPANPQQTYTPHGLIDSLLLVIEEMNLHNAIYVGNSLGGHLLLQAIDKIPNAKGIVIFGTPPLTMPPDPSKVFLTNPAIGLFFQSGLSDVQASQLCEAILSTGAKTDTEIIRLLKKSDGNFRATFAATAFGGGLKDETEIVSKLKIPIAVFHGENEKLVNLSYIQSLSVPTLWKNQVRLIKNAGHCPQWENEVEFNILLEEFITCMVKLQLAG